MENRVRDLNINVPEERISAEQPHSARRAGLNSQE